MSCNEHLELTVYSCKAVKHCIYLVLGTNSFFQVNFVTRRDYSHSLILITKLGNLELRKILNLMSTGT